jgi:hypothetical protein
MRTEYAERKTDFTGAKRLDFAAGFAISDGSALQTLDEGTA